MTKRAAINYIISCTGYNVSRYQLDELISQNKITFNKHGHTTEYKIKEALKQGLFKPPTKDINYEPIVNQFFKTPTFEKTAKKTGLRIERIHAVMDDYFFNLKIS